MLIKNKFVGGRGTVLPKANCKVLGSHAIDIRSISDATEVQDQKAQGGIVRIRQAIY